MNTCKPLPELVHVLVLRAVLRGPCLLPPPPCRATARRRRLLPVACDQGIAQVPFAAQLEAFVLKTTRDTHCALEQRDAGFRVYEEAPGFRPVPHVMTRVRVRRDPVVLSIVEFPFATFCPRSHCTSTAHWVYL